MNTSSPHASERTTRPRLTNLPLPLTRFVGRERECSQVKHLLATTRLLTLTGSGGCGKTRLALQVARSLGDQFPDGVWLIDLAPLADPALVPQAVATLFDLHESGSTPLARVLEDFCHAKEMVWVLDNCEHVIQACAELCHALLQTCPGLVILATSREPLNLAGETCLRVPSLELPESNPLPPLNVLSRCESVILFSVRAGAVRSEFQLTDTNASSIARICQQLDGMPLAIELAAARVNTFSTDEIAARLDDRFRLLNSGSRVSLPRHQTLRASIDWSYHLLTSAEQVLLQRLSVFAGGFSLQAAEVVCGMDFGGETPELLARLVLKSLVVVKLDDRPRYRLLETIRQYASERLGESRQAATIRERHREYYLDFVHAQAPRLHGPEQLEALGLLDQELDNIRSALDRSLDDGRIEKGLELAADLMWYWERRGLFREGRTRLENLLNRPEAAPRTLLRAHALTAMGLLANSMSAAWVGGSKLARPFLQEAIAIAHEHGQAGRRLLVLALTFLSNNVYQENRTLGEAQYAEAWSLVQDLDEPWIRALMLHQRAHWLEKRNELEEAETAFNRSLEFFRSVGDKRWAAILLTDIAVNVVYNLKGNYATARRLLQENISFFRETKDRMHVCFCLAHLAEVARRQGDYDLGQKYYTEQLEIARELGSRILIVAPLTNLGFCALVKRDLHMAQKRLLEAIALGQAMEDHFHTVIPLGGLACLAALEKQARHAVRIFGAIDRFMEGRRFTNLVNKALLDEHLAAARAQLGEDEYLAAWNEGHALSMDQAIKYALEETREMEPVRSHPDKADAERLGGLTAREREVAILIALGKSNPEIAETLVVSERTVTTHVTHILSKLGFTSRTQVASWATAKKLTES